MIVPCENCNVDLNLIRSLIVLELVDGSASAVKMTLDQAQALTNALHLLINEAVLEHAHEMGKLKLDDWIKWARQMPINVEEWAARNNVRLFDIPRPETTANEGWVSPRALAPGRSKPGIKG